MIRESAKLKISDLTPEEFKGILREVLEEKFKEFFFYPDYGLELKEEVEKKLNASLASEERIPLEEVKERLGLSEV